MKRKESFIVYNGWFENVSHLDDGSLGKLFRAVFEYQTTGEVDAELPPELKMAFAFIKKQLDHDSDKYLKRCEINRANGQQGGAPEGNKNAQKQPKQPKTTENKQKQHDNDNEYDNEYENESENENENARLRHNIIFAFNAAYKRKFFVEYLPTKEDHEAALPLFYKLKDAVKAKNNRDPWDYITRYFAKMFNAELLNDWHRQRLSPAHINKHFNELHQIVYERVPAFINRREGECSIDDELRAMGKAPKLEPPKPKQEEDPLDDPEINRIALEAVKTI